MSCTRLSEYLDITGISRESWFDPDLVRDLGDGTYIMTKPLLFHWTLIRVDLLDTVGYFDRWCYADRALAVAALNDFPENPDPGYEPEGWHRHPKSGRRREDADPEREYVDP